MADISTNQTKRLSTATRRKVWWRSQFLQGSMNYERMQALGWCFGLGPALKELYPNKDDLAAALKRHLEFFNTQPFLAAPIFGVADLGVIGNLYDVCPALTKLILADKD